LGGGNGGGKAKEMRIEEHRRSAGLSKRRQSQFYWGRQGNERAGGKLKFATEVSNKWSVGGNNEDWFVQKKKESKEVRRGRKYTKGQIGCMGESGCRAEIELPPTPPRLKTKQGQRKKTYPEKK